MSDLTMIDKNALNFLPSAKTHVHMYMRLGALQEDPDLTNFLVTQAQGHGNHCSLELSFIQLPITFVIEACLKLRKNQELAQE